MLTCAKISRSRRRSVSPEDGQTRAMLLERRALTGRHSRFDEVEFGATWDELVRGADRFPSSSTTVGLGRSFAWCQWARVNDVVDADFVVRRTTADRARFLTLADLLRADGTDNAQDSRAIGTRRTIPIAMETPQLELF